MRIKKDSYRKKIYISLSFDDGREDTYTRAFEIMKKYGLVGTINIVTGFIDKTWKPSKGFATVKSPLSMDELYELKNYGFEISAHGDQHITDKKDLAVCMNKIEKWGLIENNIVGFSVPNSSLFFDDIKKFIKNLMPCKVGYIRYGRHNKSYTFLSKCSYVLYNCCKSQALYNYFNRYNCINTYNIKPEELNILPSVVIRNNDDPKMLISYIEASNDGDWIIFMLHSILKKHDNFYGNDPWFWDYEKFNYFCNELKKLEMLKLVKVDTILNILSIK